MGILRCSLHKKFILSGENRIYRKAIALEVDFRKDFEWKIGNKIPMIRIIQYPHTRKYTSLKQETTCCAFLSGHRIKMTSLVERPTYMHGWTYKRIRTSRVFLYSSLYCRVFTTWATVGICRNTNYPLITRLYNFTV